jgi:uncharacterized protein
MAHEGYHEPVEELSDKTRDMHRAIITLMEEFEAIDWYNQRVDACKDDELKAVLVHNRDEEKEHAAMVLEWMRRNDPLFEQVLRTYLFTSGDITQLELEATAGATGQGSPTGSTVPVPRARFTVGSLLKT